MAAVRFAAAFAAIATLMAGAAAPRAHALEIKRMRLSNGAVLLVSEEHQLPMITLSIAFDAGARRDPKGKSGLAVLTASCMNQGTKSIPAPDFTQKVDFMGSSVGVSAGRDYAVASMKSLKKYEKQTLDLMAGILTNPGLRDADIERKRAEDRLDAEAGHHLHRLAGDAHAVGVAPRLLDRGSLAGRLGRRLLRRLLRHTAPLLWLPLPPLVLLAGAGYVLCLQTIAMHELALGLMQLLCTLGAVAGVGYAVNGHLAAECPPEARARVTRK